MYREILSRLPSSVTLLAVSKTKPYEMVESLYAEGQRLFGENRVQEIETKFPIPSERPDGMKVFMIGHLQSNKVRKAVALSDRIESVDSLKVLDLIAAEAGKIGRKIDILLEWKCSEDPEKTGFSDIEELYRAVERARGMESVNLLGLMTVGPLTDERDEIRRSFHQTRMIFEDIGGLDVLSMGMSGDWEIAIDEGSTEIRLGTLLFGSRN